MYPYSITTSCGLKNCLFKNSLHFIKEYYNEINDIIQSSKTEPFASEKKILKNVKSDDYVCIIYVAFSFSKNEYVPKGLNTF